MCHETYSPQLHCRARHSNSYGSNLYRGIIATTKRSVGLTTKIRSSNLTNYVREPVGSRGGFR
jgi:hypothetical protein